MSKRVPAGALLLTVAAALTVGLSGAAAKPQATVTLKMLFNSTFQVATEALIANFERVHPNIKIDAQFVSSPTIHTLLQTQLQAGNAPDLLYVSSANFDTSGAWVLGAAGRLLDLSSSPWVKRVPLATKGNASYKGKVYVIPMQVNATALLYNVDLFKQMGLKLPTKFADVLSLCKQVSAAGKIPFAEGGVTTIGIQIIIRPFMANFVYNFAPGFNNARQKHDLTFAGSKHWRRALQAVVDMKNANCFDPGMVGTSRPQQYAQLANGQAVMSIAGSQEVVSVLEINPKANLRFAAFPADQAKHTRVYTASGQGFGVNVKTSYPKEARIFIDFLGREKQSRLYAKIVGSMSPYDSKKGLVPDIMKDLVPFFEAGRTTSQVEAQWPLGVFNGGLSLGGVGLFTGQATVDSLLASMDKLWDSISPSG